MIRTQVTGFSRLHHHPVTAWFHCVSAKLLNDFRSTMVPIYLFYLFPARKSFAIMTSYFSRIKICLFNVYSRCEVRTNIIRGGIDNKSMDAAKVVKMHFVCPALPVTGKRSTGDTCVVQSGQIGMGATTAAARIYRNFRMFCGLYCGRHR